MYKFYNANSNGNFVNDCVVRAISAAEGISWDRAYTKLSNIAQEEGTLLDDVIFVEGYLDRNYPTVSHYSKTVGELAEEYPKGIFLVTMEGHITVIIDGIVYDTFDCRDGIIWCVWEVPRKRFKRK